jgi:hypothetical protein
MGESMRLQVGIITASASGEKGHEELQRGEFIDERTQRAFERFVDSFKRFVEG